MKVWNEIRWQWFRAMMFCRNTQISVIPWAINPFHTNWKWAFKTPFFQRYPTRINFVLFVVWITPYERQP